jgi:hypothetical protein
MFRHKRSHFVLVDTDGTPSDRGRFSIKSCEMHREQICAGCLEIMGLLRVRKKRNSHN